jgi:hypothetical protein
MAEPDTRVTVIDIRIPFWRLIAFLVKLALAAIPAAILFAIIIWAIVAALRLIGFSIFMSGVWL